MLWISCNLAMNLFVPTKVNIWDVRDNLHINKTYYRIGLLFQLISKKHYFNEAIGHFCQFIILTIFNRGVEDRVRERERESKFACMYCVIVTLQSPNVLLGHTTIWYPQSISWDWQWEGGEQLYIQTDDVLLYILIQHER